MVSPPTPPPPITAELGGALRFAVGSPTGRRSTAWLVRGGNEERDVYVGALPMMKVFKLSLHASGDWRYAYTSQHAKAERMANRVVARLDPPIPIAAGWRRAASVVIPTTSLRPPFSEVPSAMVPTSWWRPSPTPGWSINFEILVSEPEFDEHAAFDCIGEVGRIPLPGGGGIWIAADERRLEPEQVALLDELRQEVRERDAATLAASPHRASISATTADSDGRAVFFDLGELSPGVSPGVAR